MQHKCPWPRSSRIAIHDLCGQVQQDRQHDFCICQMLLPAQAKFKVPRNLASSAEWQSLKRPVLHVVEVIAWGWGEFIFLMPPDIKKDSSMECYIIARVLDLLQATLPVGGMSGS